MTETFTVSGDNARLVTECRRIEGTISALMDMCSSASRYNTRFCIERYGDGVVLRFHGSHPVFDKPADVAPSPPKRLWWRRWLP